jgi:hypothetical protein
MRVRYAVGRNGWEMHMNLEIDFPRHRLGWILVLPIEITDQCSRPPRTAARHCFFRMPVLILVWFWRAAPVD